MGDVHEVSKQLDETFAEFDGDVGSSGETTRGAYVQGSLMSVVERDGVLYVEDESTTTEVMRGRGSGEEIVWQRRLATLDRNEAIEWLTKLDTKLTPHRGIRVLEDGEWVPRPTIAEDGSVLLLVHGTFSNTDNLRNGIANSGMADAFWEWADDRYDQVAAYDHPTLSVSPMINAHALARHVGASEAAIDVVTHSRGGLVTRWWLEAFGDDHPADRRVVFVGSPLAGTGLAAPPNIKGTLSLLSNISGAVGAVATVVPLMTVVGVVFRIVSSITTLAAKTPALDAALAMIPGLVAQSRVGNNQELLSLRESVGAWQGNYFAVQSNFESERAGWRFWRNFRRDKVMDKGADLVFDGHNDLVVDTGSMSELTSELALPADQILDFGTNDRVHHMNYFEQPDTLEFVMDRFGR